MQILYVLATVFLVIWLLGVLVHALFVIVGTLIHLALPIAIVLFVLGYLRSRSKI